MWGAKYLSESIRSHAIFINTLIDDDESLKAFRPTNFSETLSTTEREKLCSTFVCSQMWNSPSRPIHRFPFLLTFSTCFAKGNA